MFKHLNRSILVITTMILGLCAQGTGTAASVGISVNQATASLNPAQTLSLAATVTGSANLGVTWNLSPNVGSLAVSGATAVYTAPAAVSSSQTITVTATTVAIPAARVLTVITLLPALNIAPGSASLTNSQTITFTTTGANSGGVVWSLSPAIGNLGLNGTNAVYTVPSSLSQSQTVQVEATSVSNSSLVAKAVLLLVPTVAIALSPLTADLDTGGQMVFTPTVTGSTNTGVNWSLSSGVGTIDNTGLYTAPSSLAQDTAVSVTALAQADNTKKASSTVTVHANGIYFTTGANGLTSVVWNGINYNYVYGEGLLSYVWIQPPGGSATQYTPTCSGTFTATSVTRNCTANGDAFTLNVVYSTPSNGTVQAQITFTNDSKTNTVTNAMVSTLGVQAPFISTTPHVQGTNETSPIAVVNFGTGQFATWTNMPGANVTSVETCAWINVCKNQPSLSNVAPGQTVVASFSLRFTGNATQGPFELAPEAYTAYQAAYPYTVTWPDRRPIYAWFMSDHGHQSATNPRGYFNQPALDVSNIPAFQATALAQAQSIVNSIKNRAVQAQGIVLWDIEGQEFIQSTSYIGDPRVLGEGYAPEMNATADQLFALFRNAGLKVGITLRPDYLQWGPKSNLPLTCNFNSDGNYEDYYVETDSAYLSRFYACSSPNAWALIPAGNGYQTLYQPVQVQQVINLLLSKVAYARARWGTTLYYVDSTVWDGGAPISASIFRALQQAYPDSLFMPEESYIGTMAVAMPYATPGGALPSPYAPVTWRYAYPSGAQVTNMSNCSGTATCWAAYAANFGIGQKIGDIALYSVPSQLSAAQLTAIESMILQARNEAGSTSVTDSSTGTVYSYTGTPATIYKYPVKMRVYFADSASDLPSSSTYCENGGWLGTNSCTLNLTGLAVAQIRYYDFEGNLVTSGTAQGR